MIKYIKDFFYVVVPIVMALVMVSCNEDKDLKEPSNHTELVEINLNCLELASKYLDDLEDFDDQDGIVSFLKSLKDVDAVTLSDKIVKVTTKGGIDFLIDLDIPNIEDVIEDDSLSFKAMTDSLTRLYYGDDVDFDNELSTTDEFGVEVESDGEIDVSQPFSRFLIIGNPVRVLKRRNVFIWSPYPEFGRDDLNTVKKAVRYRVNKQGQKVGNTIGWPSNYAPQSLSFFSYYDVVFMSTHGNINGEPYVSTFKMPKNVIDIYKKWIGKGVSGTYKTVFKNGKKQKFYLSFTLHKEILKAFMGDLSSTIMWTSFCYSGNGVYWEVCKDKNVACFFGNREICTAKDINTLFKYFYPRLDMGRSATKAFNEKGNNAYFCNKGIKGSEYTYIRFLDNYVSYVDPFATGVKTRKSRTLKQVRTNEDILLGLQYRFDLDSGQNPDIEAETGVVLKDNSNPESILYVPLANLKIVNSKRRVIDDQFIIHDLEVAVDGLAPGHIYTYATYMRDASGYKLSNSCYTFRVPDEEPKETLVFDGEVPMYHYYHNILEDGTTQVVFDGTTDTWARCNVEWMENGMPKVDLNIYTQQHYGMTLSKYPTPGGIFYDDIVYDSYKMSYDGNNITLSAKFKGNYNADTGLYELIGGFIASIDLKNRLLTVDQEEDMNFVVDGIRRHSYYHPQGTVSAN